jgi:hypothetical protein
MNVITANAAIEIQGTFARLFNSFCAQLRRAIELSGAPYVDGTLPPL